MAVMSIRQRSVRLENINQPHQVDLSAYHRMASDMAETRRQNAAAWEKAGKSVGQGLMDISDAIYARETEEERNTMTAEMEDFLNNPKTGLLHNRAIDPMEKPKMVEEKWNEIVQGSKDRIKGDYGGAFARKQQEYYLRVLNQVNSHVASEMQGRVRQAKVDNGINNLTAAVGEIMYGENDGLLSPGNTMDPLAKVGAFKERFDKAANELKKSMGEDFDENFANRVQQMFVSNNNSLMASVGKEWQDKRVREADAAVDTKFNDITYDTIDQAKVNEYINSAVSAARAKNLTVAETEVFHRDLGEKLITRLVDERINGSKNFGDLNRMRYIGGDKGAKEVLKDKEAILTEIYDKVGDDWMKSTEMKRHIEEMVGRRENALRSEADDDLKGLGRVDETLAKIADNGGKYGQSEIDDLQAQISRLSAMEEEYNKLGGDNYLAWRAAESRAKVIETQNNLIAGRMYEEAMKVAQGQVEAGKFVPLSENLEDASKAGNLYAEAMTTFSGGYDSEKSKIRREEIWRKVAQRVNEDVAKPIKIRHDQKVGEVDNLIEVMWYPGLDPNARRQAKVTLMSKLNGAMAAGEISLKEYNDKIDLIDVIDHKTVKRAMDRFFNIFHIRPDWIDKDGRPKESIYDELMVGPEYNPIIELNVPTSDNGTKTIQIRSSAVLEIGKRLRNAIVGNDASFSSEADIDEYIDRELKPMLLRNSFDTIIEGISENPALFIYGSQQKQLEERNKKAEAQMGEQGENADEEH